MSSSLAIRSPAAECAKETAQMCHHGFLDPHVLTAICGMEVLSSGVFKGAVPCTQFHQGLRKWLRVTKRRRGSLHAISLTDLAQPSSMAPACIFNEPFTN